MKKTILVVAAHPDDEVLGCGGTMARLADEGSDVYTLILGEGATARDDKRDVRKFSKELSALEVQMRKANKLLGVKDCMLSDFPDNRFDSVALLDIVKVIEKYKSEIKPDIIFTHSQNDLNIDHQITHNAVLTATRPMAGEKVREVYAFEVLSSTEWNFSAGFVPNVFFDISKYLKLKVKAMKLYESELREYPHPRSLKGIELTAGLWGMKVGLGSAEAFKCVRMVK